MNVWSLGLTMTIMGMGMVFLVLAILVLLVYLFNWLYYRYLDRSPEAEAKPVEASPNNLHRVDDLTPAGRALARGLPGPAEVSPEPPAPATLGAAGVAAITAALMCLEPGRAYRVVRVSPSGSAGVTGRVLSWAAAGRQEIIAERQQHLLRKE